MITLDAATAAARNADLGPVEVQSLAAINASSNKALQAAHMSLVLPLQTGRSTTPDLIFTSQVWIFRWASTHEAEERSRSLRGKLTRVCNVVVANLSSAPGFHDSPTERATIRQRVEGLIKSLTKACRS